MYAPQPTPPPEHPPRPSALRSRRPVRSPHRGVTAEVSTKVVVNVCLVVVSSVALVKLIPNTLRQQAQLEELQAEVTYLNQDVEQLRIEFNAYFDTTQTERLAQEEGQLLKPNQRRVVWLDPQESDARQLAHH
ncbi:MAG: hypothetical protein WBA43_02885 [Elainellaceae cyanobacterium]